ncbi:MAG: hypothetical protein H5T83_14140 [Actinotalea sp.]|nr:hypothetical protein [Actinotalea sp.]
MRRGLVGALLLSALLVLYIVAVAGRGLALVRTGEPVAVVLGLGVLVLPALGAWVLVREWRMGVAVQRMADELERQGRLPVDDLPRSPGGRIDRAAADAAFTAAQAEVEADRDDWAAWFRLAFAYDAAGDRRRARESLRTAARLRGRG